MQKKKVAEPRVRVSETKTFFNQLLNADDPKSSRRFITMLVAGIFIVTCITILVLLVCLFVSTTRLQGLNIEAMKVITTILKDVITWEAAIVMVGLCFISAADLVQILKARFQQIDPSSDTDPKTGNYEEKGDLKPE